jgi:hypothetical protein
MNPVPLYCATVQLLLLWHVYKHILILFQHFYLQVQSLKSNGDGRASKLILVEETFSTYPKVFGPIKPNSTENEYNLSQVLLYLHFMNNLLFN